MEGERHMKLSCKLGHPESEVAKSRNWTVMLKLGDVECFQNAMDKFATVFGLQIVRSLAVSTRPEY